VIWIAHRGASAERPEHTRSAYELAIEQGCDFVEPDLAVSRDGVLIVRHENEISETTDVAEHPAFARRRTSKTIDGHRLEGWFTEDFTLAELKTLRCRERLPALRPGNTRFDGQEPILTLDELIELCAEAGLRRGRGVGLYIELKHPTFFAELGLPLEPAVVAALDRHGLNHADAPVIVECFEPTCVKAMRQLTRVRTGQLIAASGAPADGSPASYAEMTTPEGLRQIAAYADAIGPDKALIWPRDLEGRSMEATSLVSDAHAAGLAVHVWTFRPENAFLPVELRAGDDPAGHGDLAAELARAQNLGVDGLFCDAPAARQAWPRR
jgi:glycerophosphoryl diester phosphodiesterase